MRKTLALGAAFAAGILLTAASFAALFLFTDTPAQRFSEPLVVSFEPGTSTRVMAAELEAQGAISSRWSFLALRALRPGAKLKAGEYEFRQPVTAWQAFEKVAQGKVLYHPITVPEGLTRFEVAEAVAKTGLVARDEFLKATEDSERISSQFPEAQTLEGFLFPETYYLARPVTAEKVIDMMIERFETVFAQVMKDATSDLQPYEIVKLASLIEKETSLPSEHGLVSSVFHNRMRRNMLLQCDPTVIYGLVLQKRYRGRLYTDDLEDPHTYNTYVHPGLPPGPIASPGRRSLEAAVRPAESDYLYFVVEAEGAESHVFSRSLDAHKRAVAAYRRTQ